MKERRLTPLMGGHLLLMGLLMIMSVVAIIVLLTGSLVSGAAALDRYKMSMVFNLILYFVNIVALCSGIVYILEGYGKRAAGVYKAFLLLTAVSSALYAVTCVYALSTAEPFDAASGSAVGYALGLFLRAVLLMAVKVVLLLLLTFGKDLGKRKSWIVFGVILAADIVFSVLWISPGQYAFLRVTAVLSRLILDGTIGLSIRGKYADKNARGSI